MRVVLAVPQFPFVRMPFILDHALGLLGRGVDVHVACTRRVRTDAVRVLGPRAAAPELLERVHDASAGRLVDVLRGLAPDVVHFELGDTAVRYARRVKEELGCAVTMSLRGGDIAFIGLQDEARYEDVWASVDAVHCLSEGLWRHALRRGCPPDKPHALIGGGVDTGFFTPPQRPDGRVGTRERPLRLLTVARLVWKKGHDYALLAVRRLLDAGLAVEYRICGDGNERTSVEACIEDLALGDAVRLRGLVSRKRVRDEYAKADVFLLASLSEGFANACAEAQSMALPVVCTDAEGLEENVADGVSGFVVPRRDPVALAERISMLAADGGLRRRMGEAGTQRATGLLSLEAQTDRFVEFFASVCEARRT